MRGPLLLLACLWMGCGPRDVERPPLVAEPPTPATVPGFTRALRLEARSHPLPEGAPSVVLHLPDGTRATGAPVVVYLHGWESCIGALVAEGEGTCLPGGPPRPGSGLTALHDGAEVGAVLVVVQLAYDARSSSAGAFADPAFARDWWAEVRAALADAGVRPAERVVGMAHSGGYRTLQALLDSQVPVTDAVFLDGLYGGAEAVADWVVGGSGRRAISVHTAHDGTTGQSRRLAEGVRAVLGADAVAVDPVDLDAALSSHAAVTALTDVAHGAVPRAFYGPVLSGLRERRR